MLCFGCGEGVGRGFGGIYFFAVCVLGDILVEGYLGFI